MSLVDGVSFNAQSGGTGPFVFASPRPSFRTLAQAVADGALSDGQTVSYLAQDSLNNPKQREWGHGTFTAASGSIARTTVFGGIDNGNDTGTSAVGFAHPPVVSLTLLAEDLGGSNQRTVLSGNTTYYVSTTGSDVTGAGTSGNPWATLQHAANQIAMLDGNGFTITVQIADGTYAGFTVTGAPVGIGRFYAYVGNITTPANVVINDVVGGFSCIDIETGIVGPFQLSGFTVQPKVANNAGVTIDNDFILLYIAGLVFDGTVVNATDSIGVYNNYDDVELGFDQANFYGASGNRVSSTWKGTWNDMIAVDDVSVVSIVASMTMSGTPHWNSGAVMATTPGAVILGNGEGFTGSATGPRFVSENGGFINGNGSGDASYYPGSSPGIIFPGSYYDGRVGIITESGPPSTGNLPAGSYSVIKDTTQATGFGNALYVNDNGSIINLTPKFFLNANTTFYVSTTGSDANSGLSAAHPWKTLQHAADVLATNVDANGFTVTVQIADGTYAGFTINGVPQGIGNFYQFLGNVTTPANVIVQQSPESAACIDIECLGQAVLQFGGMTIQPPNGHNGVTLNADFNLVYFAKVIFDGTNTGQSGVAIFNNLCEIAVGFDQSGSLGGGAVGCSWKSSWGAAVENDTASVATFVGAQTLISTPSFSTAFALCDAPGAIITQIGATFVGSATGSRFKVSGEGQIVADGTGNLNFYPGNTAGTITNGFYDGFIYSRGSTPPNGQVASYTATLPTTVTSSGSQFQYTFDGSGNLYFCYAPNTWAKYTNAAPFDNSGGGASEPIPVIFG